MAKQFKPETLCVQAGWTPKKGEPRVLPIYQSTTFKYDTSEQMARLFDLEDNITLVKAIKYIGPTLTSIFGALEPLTAVVIGCLIFNESFTPASAIGMALIITAVTVVVVHEKKKESES